MILNMIEIEEGKFTILQNKKCPLKKEFCHRSETLPKPYFSGMIYDYQKKECEWFKFNATPKPTFYCTVPNSVEFINK